jgi:hypothetical protein
MFNNLRKRLIFFIINRNLNKTRIAGRKVSIHEAGKVGIVVLIDSRDRLSQVINFKKTLESYGSDVVVLGFVPLTMIPDYFNTQMQIEVFSKKQTNIFGIPVGKSVKHFVSIHFDVLIDLSLGDHLPLLYLAGMSKSRIKAGKFREPMKKVYDLMIKDQEGMSYEKFQFTMKNYLSKINTAQT